jgi:hypothetical protein
MRLQGAGDRLLGVALHGCAGGEVAVDRRCGVGSYASLRLQASRSSYHHSTLVEER